VIGRPGNDDGACFPWAPHTSTTRREREGLTEEDGLGSRLQVGEPTTQTHGSSGVQYVALFDCLRAMPFCGGKQSAGFLAKQATSAVGKERRGK